jgi:hypothetical protein
VFWKNFSRGGMIMMMMMMMMMFGAFVLRV